MHTRTATRLLCAAAASIVLHGCSGDTRGEVSADSASGSLRDGPATPVAEMQTVLDAHASLQPKPLETLTPDEARQQPTIADAVGKVLMDQQRDTAALALVPGVTSVDRSIPGAAGSMPATVYTPQGAGPFPVIVYYHGGGWVIADRKVYDGGARGLAHTAQAIVVSVDYRLAPEHKFPAQHDDALAAYKWVAMNATSMNGDSSRLALAGESAGGNLAVATAIAARDAGVTMPVAIISVYPIAQADTMTESYVRNANAKPLSRAGMGWFAKHVANTPADLQDPRISLVKANLRGLPAVTIINAEIDPLLDDGAMLERALRDAGVSVERRVFDGMAHEFFGTAAVSDKAKEAQKLAGDRLKAVFGAGQR